ncbi:MAG TPA: peroxiredoxin-like family protein [Methylomirabilota bacterium]|nr:peroxiredoxin-like family protein [Methylomirabilota bacterium]
MTSKPIIEVLEETFEQCRDMDASLNERLQTFAGQVRVVSPPFAEAVDRLVARLQRADAGATAPMPGDPLPPFLLPDSGGRLVGLEELLARGPVAVVFHRGHWCPYCRINTNALARAHRDIQEAGGQIVAIMPDREQFTSKLQSAAETPFPILTDVDNGYALSLNLAIWVGAEMEGMMAAAGVDLPAYQGNDSWILPIPATFVVGADGRIRARFVDPDYRRRMAIDDLLKALRAAR